MKNKLLQGLTSLCAIALALTPFFHYSRTSVVFFGEPEYPAEEK